MTMVESLQHAGGRARRALSLVLAVVTGIALLLLPTAQAHAATVSFTLGAARTDTGGNTLQLHGLGIIKVGSTWYGFGEDKTGESSSNTSFQDIPCYSSTASGRYPEGLMCEASVEPFLLFEHVNVARGSQRVLHDINLSIRPGENVVILGPNGCGKSTLIKAMTCEIYPLVEPGMRVRIFGRERWDLQELRRRLGVVSPELPGKPTLKTTGLDAVVSGFFSSSTLWPNLAITDEMRSKAEDALRLVEGEVLAEKFVGQMSAGQQRRVMIARALVRSNEMLLLDEPSNALDIAAQRSLRLTLRQLAQRGTGILLITHHIEDILPEIDRVIMMRDGRIVADGAKHDLLTGERLSQLFDTEVELRERDGFYSMA